MRKDVGRNRYFTPAQAIEYGIIDRIVRPQEEVRPAATASGSACACLCPAIPCIKFATLCTIKENLCWACDCVTFSALCHACCCVPVHVHA